MQTIIALFVLGLGHFFCDFMIGIWPLYKTLAGIDMVTAGMIYAGSALLGESSQLFFGARSDGGSRNAIIAFGLILTTSALWLSSTTDPALLFLFFLITCLGSGAFHPAASGLVTRLTTNRKSLFVTIFATCGFLGMAVSQVVFIRVYEISPNWVPILGLPLIGLLFLVMRLPNYASVKKEPFSLALFGHFFKNQGLRNLYILQVTLQSISWALIFLLPDLLKARGHEDWLVFGGGHMAYISGGALMLIPSGLLADRLSSKSVLQSATIIGMLSFFALLLLPLLESREVVPLLFVLGASISLINPVSVALGSKVVPHRGGAISAFLMGGVWAVSEVIGPGGGAILSTLFNQDGAASALLIMGTFFPVGLLMTFFLPQEVADDTFAPLQ